MEQLTGLDAAFLARAMMDALISGQRDPSALTSGWAPAPTTRLPHHTSPRETAHDLNHNVFPSFRPT
jgi:hypothetical protein